MLRGLWKLTWVEIKIFMREPMGLIGTVGFPVLIFVGLGQFLKKRSALPNDTAAFIIAGLPVLATMLIALSAVLSLIAIISIYREGGILKRLRATPLRPQTILTTHVIVKLLLTALTLALLVVAGKRFYPIEIEANPWSFALAMLISMVSILSLGFVVASVVPTARFAQPIGSLILYPMLVMSGLFFPLEILPTPWRVAANFIPLTHAVSLMQGIWEGGGWSDHGWNVLALALNFLLCTVQSAKVFRWE